MLVNIIDISGSYLKTKEFSVYAVLSNVLKWNIQQVSVDLRVGKLFAIGKTKLVDTDAGKVPPHKEVKLPHILKPGEYAIAQTIEEIHQGKRKYACLLQPRSRAFRIGLSIQTNLWGPAYEGPITFGIANLSPSPVKISRGASLVQLAFIDIKGEVIQVTHTFQGGRVL